MSDNTTFKELVNVVTSVTEGLDYENQDQLSNIFPYVSTDFIKVVKESHESLSQDEADGAQTLPKASKLSRKFLEMLPGQIGIIPEAPDFDTVFGVSSGSELLRKRQRVAEYEAVLRNELKPFKHDYSIPDVKPNILNVVASATLGVELDLKKIGRACQNVEYSEGRFAPCVMRVRKPKSTCLIFSSGRMVVSGCKTEADCRVAARKYARAVQRALGLDPNLTMVLHFEIQNISANTQLNFPVNIQAMAEYEDSKEFVSYEAELFPGLVFSLNRPKVKIVIFASGALLMTGMKVESEVQRALDTIYPYCRRFRR